MKHPISIIALVTCIILLAGGCAHKKNIKPTPTLQQAELERQRIADSIAQAEAAKKAMIQNLYVPRMTLSVSMQDNTFTTPATLRWQRGAGAQVSIQPFAGLEMLRVELNAEGLTVIDKINRRYTRMSYADMKQMGAQITLDDVDTWVDENILARRDEPQLSLHVSQADINGSVILYTSSMQTDVNASMRSANVSGYQKVTLEQLVKGL